MDGEGGWTVGELVAERSVYQGHPFEVWEGHRTTDGTPVQLSVGGGPEESELALMRDLSLEVDGVMPLLAVVRTTHGDPWAALGQPRQVLVEHRPTGHRLAELAPLPEPIVARLVYDLAMIATSAEQRGIALAGLCPESCFASEVDGALRIRGVAPRMAELAMRTNNGHFARPAFDGLYMAPEVLALARLDPTCASFSLGLLATFLVSGRHPYPLDPCQMQAMRASFEGVPVEIDASPALADVVRASTTGKRADRPRPSQILQMLAPLVDDPSAPDAFERPPRVSAPTPVVHTPSPSPRPPRRKLPPMDARFLIHPQLHELRAPEPGKLTQLDVVLEAASELTEALALEVEIGERHRVHDYITSSPDRPLGIFVRSEGCPETIAEPFYDAEVWTRRRIDRGVLEEITTRIDHLESADPEYESHWLRANVSPMAIRLPNAEALTGRTRYLVEDDGTCAEFSIRWRGGQAWCIPTRYVRPALSVALAADTGILRISVAVSTWAEADAPGRPALVTLLGRLRALGFLPT